MADDGDRADGDDLVRRVLELVPELLRRDRPRADVFRDVVELARSLLGGRYAVGALIRDDGSVLQSSFSGLPDEVVQSLGDFPTGVGVTADVLSSSVPVRLTGVDADDLATGLPAGHPPVRSFLGVRVTVNRRTIGLLYVVDPVDADGNEGSFTEDDERLISSLGSTLGAAMENRALLRDALQARRWLHAASTLAHDLFSADPQETMRLIGDRARELAEADLVALAVIEDGTFRIKHLRGLAEVELRKFDGYPVEASAWAARVMESRRGAVVSRIPASEAPQLRDMVPQAFGPSMLLPLLGEEAVLGVLFLARHEDSPPFTDTDVEVAGAFANRAAVMLELAAARQVAERVRLVEDRNRIARDLHDHVVQRLFATGLSLQQVLQRSARRSVSGSTRRCTRSTRRSARSATRSSRSAAPRRRRPPSRCWWPPSRRRPRHCWGSPRWWPSSRRPARCPGPSRSTCRPASGRGSRTSCGTRTPTTSRSTAPWRAAGCTSR
jgi:GAF domain-containing protein